MARRADPTPGHQRLLGLAAVTALSVATALAFGRVFTGRQATLELVAAALASVAIAALFERRGLLLATLASLVGLAFAITWIVLPQTAWYGLPSIQTLRAVGRSLDFVGQQARVRVAPTPALPPLMLAAVTAVWTAAFSSHALAIRAGSPLLAILPPIALVGFADTVLEDGARPFYAIVLLAAALAVVFADGLRRVRQWGPVWSGSRTRRLGTTVRGSRPVAFAVIAAAVLVPGLLPGFRSDPLVDFSTAGDEGAGLDPFVSIHAQLTDDAPVRDLFEVQTSEPQYWRLLTLDEFDGQDWRSSDPDGTAGQTVSVPTALPQAPGFNFPGDTPPAQNFTFRILTDFDNAHALPMAQTPVEITAGDLGDVRWDPTRGQAFMDGGLEAGEQLVIAPSDRQAPLDLPVEPLQLGEQHGALNRVHPAVDPQPRVVVAAFLAVMPDLAHGRRERIVVGEHGAALAVAAERLAGKEARRTDRRERAAAAPLVARAEALRSVLDHGNAVFRGDRIDLVHIGRLAIERDRHDRPGARRNRGGYSAHIDVARVGLDIDEDRLGAEQDDHLGRRDEREWARDHFVAGLQPDRHQRDLERVGPAAAGDAVPRPDVMHQSLLELRHLGAEDELPVIEDLLDPRVDRVAQLAVLSLEVDEVHWIGVWDVGAHRATFEV